jgi:DNA (cytosine-5)-methyltransferase 1
LKAYKRYLKKELTQEEFWSLVPKKIHERVICESLAEETMASIQKKIDKSMRDMRVSQIDLLVGGPPCQAYSLVGRGRKCMDNDPRNLLYRLYIKIIERYRPRMFVFENVPGLLTAGNGSHMKNIIQSFADVGYSCQHSILDASDYGVLQHRKRVIIIGWKSSQKRNFPTIPTVVGRFKVKNLLSDLPPVLPGQSRDKYEKPSINRYLKETGIRQRGDVLTWHVARNHIERDRTIYRIAINKWNRTKQRIRYNELPEELKTHKNKTGFLDRYKVVAGNLPASHTMMAHIAKDGHYYIHPDIHQARSLTVREAARIQSFPDDFYFEGSRTSAFTQIGNAVPPLMAKSIAKAIYSQLETGNKNEQNINS